MKGGVVKGGVGKGGGSKQFHSTIILSSIT